MAVSLTVRAASRRLSARKSLCQKRLSILPIALTSCNRSIRRVRRSSKPGPVWREDNAWTRSEPESMSTAAIKPEIRPAESAIPPSVPGAGNSDLLDTMLWLPCALTLEVPVVRFTIADLLALTRGSIVETACHHTSDVPLRVNRLLIGWTEFEVNGDRLAIRITDLA